MSDNNASFSIALKYHTLGRCVIPSGGGRDGKTRLWHGIRLRNVNDTDISDKTNGCAKLTDKIRQDFPENSLIKEKQKNFTENTVKSCQIVSNVSDSDIPDYSAHPCPTCGCGDYWLTDWNQWLCSRCHPKPGSSNNAE